MKQQRPVYIVGGLRTPFVKSMGPYLKVTTQEMMTATLQGLVDKYKLQGKLIGDVALGGVMLGPQNWNLARESVLGTNLHPHTPAYNVQRACGTSLETANHVFLKIAAGQMENGIAAGVDSNSDLPILFPRSFSQKILSLNSAKSFGEKLQKLLAFAPKDWKPVIPGVLEPRTGLSMGGHTEKMVKEWKISRKEQDYLAFESHQKAAQAYKEGFHADLIMKFQGLEKDTITRADTDLEKLGKLKPAFDFSGTGTLTAGNSTPLTDGASAVLIASEEECQKNNWPKLARFVDCEAAAVNFVEGEGLLMAPTVAVARLLKRNNLKLQDFDYYEIHEAFAGQVLCTLKAWETPEYCQKVLGLSEPMGAVDRRKMNVKGGSLALGHPFGATGGRIVASLAKTLSTKPGQRGLISICTAGGMGVAAILES